MAESASAMNDLIEQMHKADAEVAKLRAGAKPVSEDPYKKHDPR
jgi:ribosome-binding factor A